MPRLQQTGVTPNFETSSGTTPDENDESFDNPLQLDTEIPRGTRSPTGGLIQGKPVGRSPLGVEAGQSAGGGLNVTVSAPIGGPISARGGVNIGGDGTIKGGQIGLGVGTGPVGASIDVGTDQDESGRGGCYRYVTVTIGLFSHTYGRNVCEPKPPKPPDPSPSSSPSPTPTRTTPIASHLIGCRVTQHVTEHVVGEYTYPVREPGSVFSYYTIKAEAFIETINVAGSEWRAYGTSTGRAFSDQLMPYSFEKIFYNGTDSGSCSSDDQKRYKKEVNLGRPATLDELNTALDSAPSVLSMTYKRILYYNCPTPTAPPPAPPTYSPPPPNPPPKKRMNNNECCRKSLILQAEILRLLGRELGPEGLVPQTKKPGFIGEEIERIETPILDPNKPKKIKVQFSTIYDLLLYSLRQANDLDVALDPKSYKVPTGKVQNPAYSRDAEHSLLKNNQPDKDKAGNKRELEINKGDEIKIGGFLQQQAYAFQMLKRLEYLFPFGELSDALIARNLLIPGAEGDIKVHNMIHAYELQMQYLNSTFGDPREVLTIKDANPAVAGDQPVEVKALSVTDWLRQVVKFQIDTGGDVDATMNLALRNFRTDLANRTDIIKTAEMIQALFEDSGMREQQDYIAVHLEGDPYAGQWVKGEGFKPNPDLEKKTEEATEKVLRETMKPTEIKLKVSRRHKEEKTDMRDLLRGLADFVQRLLSVPSAGDLGQTIDKLIESAKFKVQTEAALLRANVVKAATASRNRTKKRKK